MAGVAAALAAVLSEVAAEYVGGRRGAAEVGRMVVEGAVRAAGAAMGMLVRRRRSLDGTLMPYAHSFFIGEAAQREDVEPTASLLLESPGAQAIWAVAEQPSVVDGPDVQSPLKTLCRSGLVVRTKVVVPLLLVNEWAGQIEMCFTDSPGKAATEALMAALLLFGRGLAPIASTFECERVHPQKCEDRRSSAASDLHRRSSSATSGAGDDPETMLLRELEEMLIERQLLQDDVRLLKAAQEELAQKLEAKNAYFTNQCHELRTPLNGIMGMAALLSGDTSLSEDQQAMIDIMQSSGRALHEVVKDILDMSKLEEHQLVLNPSDFHLRKLLDDVIRVVSGRAHEKGIWVHLFIDRRVPKSLSGDTHVIHQIVLNLLSNAVKFSFRGSVTISVVPAACGDKVLPSPDAFLLEISVEDTGIGMSEDQLAALFRRFAASSPILTKEGRHLSSHMSLVVLR